ncbi:MAG: helix-turn-helix domain-containing protein [Lysobacter sp.]|nr:helix-turn-helix domain-containing protein [Lysobacter sp.]
MSTMPYRIRRARNIANLTQTKLADYAGVNRSAVAQWESVKGTSPSMAHLVQIAVAADVCFEWLATGRGPCRPEDKFETAALAIWEFAQNDCELKALELLRRLSPKKQLLACRLLELFAAS